MSRRHDTTGPAGLLRRFGALAAALALALSVACSGGHGDGHGDDPAHGDPAHSDASHAPAPTQADANHPSAATTHAAPTTHAAAPAHADASTHADPSTHAATTTTTTAPATAPTTTPATTPATGGHEAATTEPARRELVPASVATGRQPQTAESPEVATTAGHSAAPTPDLPPVDATRNARAAKTAKAILDSSRRRSAETKARQASAATEGASATQGAATPTSADDSWSTWLPWGEVSEREKRPGDAAPLGLTEELTAEVRALREWLTLPVVLFLGALVALAWFATRVIRWVLRLLFRLGVERAPWVDNLGMVGRLAIWAWVLLMILIRAWRIAPMITLLGVALVAAGLMVGLVKHFENLSTGIGLALRGRIKAGDQITVGEHTGMVRAVGLMHVHLRTPEGSTVFLPNRLLAGEAVQIGRARNSYPLRARLTAPRAWPPEALEAARCVASLSPYRDVNSRISVGTEGKDGRALVVEIQVWSPRLLDAADKHLRAMLEQHLRTLTDA
ncbi:MAG: mechanosensitive ion channel family protein [Nannocystaceae bacterium]